MRTSSVFYTQIPWTTSSSTMKILYPERHAFAELVAEIIHGLAAKG